MAREGHVLTRTLHIETRQHELLGLDLGEGPLRSAMIFGALLMVGWVALMFVLLGLPNKFELPLFILPPTLVSYWGWQEDEANPRRRKITTWLLAIRNVRHGQEPIVALGRHVRRHDHASLLTRVARRFSAGDPWALVKPWRLEDAAATPPDPARVARPDPVRFAPRVRQYSVPAIREAMDRRARHATHSAKTAAQVKAETATKEVA